MYNKKGQVGETVTWIVATILIFVIILFFGFGASLLGDTKNIVQYKNQIFSKAGKISTEYILDISLYTYSAVSSDATKKEIKFYLENQSYDFANNLKELNEVSRI